MSDTEKQLTPLQEFVVSYDEKTMEKVFAISEYLKSQGLISEPVFEMMSKVVGDDIHHLADWSVGIAMGYYWGLKDTDNSALLATLEELDLLHQAKEVVNG